MIEQQDEWTPDALLKRLTATPGMVVKAARVECGGEHGSIVSFTTDANDRFTYTMPSKPLAVRAVMRMVMNDDRFPLKLTVDSKDRAVFERRV